MDQVNKEVVNTLEDNNFELDKSVLDYQSATVYYIVSKILNRYFRSVMQQQKIIYWDSNS